MDSLGIQCVRLDFKLGLQDNEDDASNEIRKACFGRACELLKVDHPCLAKVLAARIDSQGRLVLVSEHSSLSLRSVLLERKQLPEEALKTIARGIFEGLVALSSLGLVHLGLCPENVLFCSSGRLDSVVLSGWGLHHATDAGRLVSPPVFVGALDYAPPEGLAPGAVATGKAAVWNAGVCLLEILTGRNAFAESAVLAASCRDSDVIRELLEVPELDRCSRELRELLMGCLVPKVASRYDAATALRSPFCSSGETRLRLEPWPYLRAAQFTGPSLKSLFPHVVVPFSGAHSRTPSVDTLDGSGVGGINDRSIFVPDNRDVEQSSKELAEALLDQSDVLLPELAARPGPAVVGCLLGQPLDLKWNPNISCVLKAEARARLAIPPAQIRSNAEQVFELWRGDPAQASLDLRERDCVYQQNRVTKLLPLIVSRDVKAVQAEACVDVPPVLRDQVWAVLLGLASWSVCEKEWSALDLAAETAADHQIAVDVPRCNARHELIGTQEGRRRLTRVLKAWVMSNAGLEYWQGLDSLAAPFVAITWNSGGEARAFALLQRMVRKFLSGMFLQKNTSQLQTQLIVFNQLLAFHDPKLFLHLHKHQFLPELFAIPWFLTLFTHILPIDATLRLWDFLFLHEATMIHFVSIAVMRQLRSRLLAIDFNDMVLFFSELHSKQGLDMEKVISDAVKVAAVTPNSLATDHFFGVEKPSLESLQEHHSPKLFVADFVTLIKEGLVPVVVFDTRSVVEWQSCRLDGSINIPSPKDVDIKGVEQVRVKARPKKPIIVVIAPESNEFELPNILVQAGISRVTYLSGGIGALLAISHPAIKIIKT